MMSMSCLFVCLSVRTHIQKHVFDLRQHFYACCPWPSLGPPLAVLRCNSGFVDDVTFAHNGWTLGAGDTNKAQAYAHTYSPDGSMDLTHGRMVSLPDGSIRPSAHLQ